MKDRLRALEDTLGETIGAAQAAADRVLEEQRAQLAYLEEGDPLDMLNSVEQNAAATRNVFIAEDAPRLKPAALLIRCRQAMAQSGRATCYLLARHVSLRIEAAMQEA